MFVFYTSVAFDGAETRGGASSSVAVWNHRGKLAGKPHPEGVSAGLLLGPTGYSLPGCWTGGNCFLNLELLVQKQALLTNRACLQVKSVKPCLKQLQQCIQTISTLHDDEILPSNPADLFHWLPKEHMCVLVYLVMLNQSTFLHCRKSSEGF